MADDEKIITFGSYYDPMLAHIIKTKLEANGVPCFIADENTAVMNPFYNQAIGGVKVRIFERDLVRSNLIIKEDTESLNQDNFEIDYETTANTLCPFCDSVNVKRLDENLTSQKKLSTFNVIVNFLNPFKNDKNWHCFNCNRNFD